MSGRPWVVAAVVFVSLSAQRVEAQQRREREPNSVYAERRAKLASQVDAPIILWGFTGREEISQDYVFAQEENFYYLTGHNEEGAGLILLPPAQGNHAAPADASLNGQRGILFLPPKSPDKEKWNGVRMSSSDPGIEARTGFPSVKRSEEHTSELQSHSDLVCRLLLEKKNNKQVDNLDKLHTI